MVGTQGPGERFARKLHRGTGRFLSLLGLTGAMTLASYAQPQTASAPPRNTVSKSKPSISSANPSPFAPDAPAPVEPAPIDPPSTPPTAAQTPPQPPVVTWDGDVVTIDAENSTLAAILAALQTKTGASIDVPPAASAERVFVHLGPGPVRDIVSSLLYGTQFDYIIEASDDDPDTLRRVVVTARGRDDDSVLNSLADGSNTQGATHTAAGPRMMRGWAASGKPAFQAEAEAAIAAEQAAAPEAAGSSDTADSNVQDQSAARSESASGGQEASSSSQSSSSGGNSSANASSPGGTDSPSATAEVSSTASSSDSNNPTSHMIQNMTNMFEQRRQIQAKQNQAAQQPQSPD